MKYLLTLTTLSAALALAACGKSDGDTPKTEAPKADAPKDDKAAKAKK